jgi:3-(3-hydroxy-phenyl)propionate hydroxylase
MSRRFRAFIGRGGVLPPPQIRRSALTGVGRDALIGQMLPQPAVRSTEGVSMLDAFQGCHQWMVLGVGVDPATMLSGRDRAILDVLGARYVCVNGRSEKLETIELRCDDPAFAAWVKRHGVCAVLVRPDHFIAQRLDPRARRLSVLTMFATVPDKITSRIAA